jgi:hypothetical protein
MWKALAIKEIREDTWIAAVALAVYLLIVIDNIGWNLPGFLSGVSWIYSYGYRGGPQQIPFVANDFVTSSAIVSALLAIAIAFRQTLGESLHETWLLLWRLPIRRNDLLYAKLLVGLVTYLFCAALPIAIFAAWAATPGTHASPFYWSMTLPAWASWFSMTALYLAAFLSGLRSARWIGSRLLPLAAVGLPVFVLHAAAVWWLTVPIVIVLDVLFLVCIQQAARVRDYS